MTGSEILAAALKKHAVDTVFFLMGGPLLPALQACQDRGLRMIDVRHEQAAAFMGVAYSRILRKPGVCMAASGPGTTNLVTGVAHALTDRVPLFAIGGASPLSQIGSGAFQELDQVALMKPITNWAARVYDPRRIPEFVNSAMQHAFAPSPGPVYLDVPGDVLYQDVVDSEIRWSQPVTLRSRPLGDPEQIERVVQMMLDAERPILLTGSGILWSEAEADMREIVNCTGIPFWTTPQGRGAVEEDHELCFLTARSTAFREADLIIVIGTRRNYVIDYARPPRFSAAARVVQVDIDPTELGREGRLDVGIQGDARAVIRQLLAACGGRLSPDRYASWQNHLRAINTEKMVNAESAMSSDAKPIHPLRLCKEVRDFLTRDCILVLDGQEILNYARQSIPYYKPVSLNSGTFGTMGVGLPFGLGAKAAQSERDVVVLQGDGSFGLNAMELDTAVRMHLPVLTIISNNGGWTAVDRPKVGRDLGFTRYDRLAVALGCHGEYVEDPSEIGLALRRARNAVASGQPAVVNVITDPSARAQTIKFTAYTT
jgi:thiamine pyrophosphate-dependent acetolactate synthase large subunit-like protein